jgi:hypothetical protein
MLLPLVILISRRPAAGDPAANDDPRIVNL